MNEEKVTNPTVLEDGSLYFGVENLDDIVKSFRKFLLQRKFSNYPNPQNRNYLLEVVVGAAQYTKQIVYLTQGLIENKKLESDPYGFLTGTVDSFQRWNKLINTEWVPTAKKVLAEEEQKLKQKEAEQSSKDSQQSNQEVITSAEDSVLSSVEIAAIVAEPRGKEDVKVEVKTTKHQKWIFDKKEFTLTYQSAQGKRVIKIAPQGSWRSTILKWIYKICAWIKQKYIDFKDRCIGIKQTIQFKIEMKKFEKRMKAEAKAEEDRLKAEQAATAA